MPTPELTEERQPCFADGLKRNGVPIPCFQSCICTCGTDFPYPCECHERDRLSPSALSQWEASEKEET